MIINTDMAPKIITGFHSNFTALAMKVKMPKIMAISSSPKNAQKINAKTTSPNISHLPFYRPLSAFADKCARGIKWLMRDLLALTLTINPEVSYGRV